MEDNNRTCDEACLEEKCRTLLMLNSEAIFHMSPDWSVMTKASSRGCDKEKSEPDPAWKDKYIHPEDRDFFDNAIHTSIMTKTKVDIEHRMLLPDGSTVWVNTRAFHIFKKNGDIAEWFGTVSGITIYKNKIEELNTRIKRYQERIKFAPACIYEIDFQQKRFLLVNDIMCQLTGYSREELLNMNPLEILEDGSKNVFSNRMKKWAGGEKIDEDVNYIIRTKDGRKMQCDLHINLIKDKNDYPIGATVISYDVTEHKKMEQSLKDSEANFRSIFENSPIGIAVVNAKGIVVQSNASIENMLGFDKEELLGKSFQELSHSGDLQTETPLINDLIEGKSDSYTIEKRFIRKNGEEIWVRLINTIMKNQNESLCLAMAEDITESRNNEERLEFQANLLSSVNEAIIAVDKDFCITYWNKAAERMYGWTAEEAMGESIKEIVSELFPRISQEKTAEDLLKEDCWNEEVTYHKKNRESISIEIYIKALRNEKGEFAGTITSSRDITERKKADEKLLRNERRNELIANITSRLLTSQNPERIIEELCRLAMEFIGCDVFFNYLADKERGNLHLNAYAGIKETEASKIEWLGYGEGLCGYAAQKGTSLVVECISEASCDPRIEAVAALGIKTYACHPLKAANRVIGTLAFAASKQERFSADDISLMSTVSDYIAIALGRLIANRKLVESERRALKLVVELNTVKNQLTEEVEALITLHKLNSNFIIQDDLNKIYEGILEAAVSLTSAGKGSVQIFDDTENKLRLILGHKLSGRFLERYKLTALDTGTCGYAYKERKRIIEKDITTSLIFKDRPALTYLLEEGIRCVQSTPLISSSGRIVGVLNTYYESTKILNERELRMLDMLARLAADTIERTMTEEALKNSERKALALIKDLEKSDRNKNDFINMLSHELRNPLATIMAGVSLLDITDNEAQAAHAKEIIKRQSVQLCRLVDDLLDITRITQNKVKLKKDIINLNELVLQAVSDIKSRFDAKGIFLNEEMPVIPVRLNADPARVTQMVENLLCNALKFTVNGGYTNVRVFEEKGNAVIEVKDNGIGIKPEILSEIFEPFVQADESLDRHNGGLGLGLAITKGFVELHGGSISAFSDGPGKGSLFTVSLPVRKERDKKQADDKLFSVIQRPNKILIIEDNIDFAELLCSMFIQMGNEAYAAFNSNEGIEKIKSYHPDVIFCDIGLPGINGYEIAKMVRADDSLKHIILIALTGYAAPKDIKIAMESGFNMHIAKPVNIETLRRVLKY